MSTSTCAAIFPHYRVDEILNTVKFLVKDAQSRLLADATDPSGPFTKYTSGIHLDFLKAALGPGHAARQILDCWLIDELATSLRSQGVKTGMITEEYGAAVDRAEKHLEELKKGGPTADGTVSFGDIKKLVSGYAGSLATGNKESEYEVPSEVAFLRVYDEGLERIHQGVLSYIPRVEGLSDNMKKRLLNSLPKPMSYYDAIHHASQTIWEEHGIWWETVRQSFMQSSGARNRFWSDEMKEPREKVLSKSGLSVGPWPELPKELNDWTKAQTASLFSGKSIVASETGLAVSGNESIVPETESTMSRKRRRL